jgi:hypothetical protein
MLHWMSRKMIGGILFCVSDNMEFQEKNRTVEKSKAIILEVDH